MRTTIRGWRFLVDNEACTNEPLPQQTKSVIDYIRARILKAPAQFGYDGSEFKRELDEDCWGVTKNLRGCSCVGTCENCYCKKTL